MTQTTPVNFSDVSGPVLERYLHDAITLVLKREARAKYTHDSRGHTLPKIMIVPPSAEKLKAGKEKAVTKIVETREELSKNLKHQIHAEIKAKHERLKKQYDGRIMSLKAQIVGLESDISAVMGELEQYMDGTHPHLASHISAEDLESEVSVLEHKLKHYETRGEKYQELVTRLTSARDRLHAIQL